MSRAVVVVGGGPCGLIAAWLLAQRGQQPLLLEAQPEPGGALRGTSAAGEPIERLYHHLLPADRRALGLIERLGLAHGLRWLAGSSALWDGRDLAPLSGPLDALCLPLLKPAERLRLLAGMAACRLENLERLLDVPLRVWAPQRLGFAAWDKLWLPLLRRRLGPTADDQPASWLAWRLSQRSSGGLGRQGRYGVLDNGMQTLAHGLAQRIEAAGGELACNNPVARIERNGDAWRVSGEWGEETARRVVLALPPAALAAVQGDLPDELRRAAASVPALAAAVALVVTDAPPGPHYWVNSIDPLAQGCGAVTHTNLAGLSSRFAGCHVTHVPFYAPANDPAMRLPDAELARRLADDLLRLAPLAPRILDLRLYRYSQAHALRDSRFIRSLPQLRAEHDGLVWASDALVWPADRGLDACVLAAEGAVARL